MVYKIFQKPHYKPERNGDGISWVTLRTTKYDFYLPVTRCRSWGGQLSRYVTRQSR